MEGAWRGLQAVAHPERGGRRPSSAADADPDDPELLAAAGASTSTLTSSSGRPAAVAWRGRAAPRPRRRRRPRGRPRSRSSRPSPTPDNQRPDQALRLLKIRLRALPQVPSLGIPAGQPHGRPEAHGGGPGGARRGDRRPAGRSPSSTSAGHDPVPARHLNDARRPLVEGLDRVPKEQKTWSRRASAELAPGPEGLPHRRQRHQHWAELQPENPEPRLALLELAMLQGDRVSEMAATPRSCGPSPAAHHLSAGTPGSRTLILPPARSRPTPPATPSGSTRRYS